MRRLAAVGIVAGLTVGIIIVSADTTDTASITTSAIFPLTALDIDASVSVIASTPEEMLNSSDTQAQRMAADELVTAIIDSWPAGHRRNFLVAIAPVALISATQHCLPPSVTIGQAIIESGWGRSGLTRRHNNLFGVKETRSGQGVSLSTQEVVNGEERRETAQFRTFDDWEASVKAHDALLENDRRYEAGRAHWRDWPEYLASIAPIYASDPAYVSLVTQLINRYGLDRWDGLTQGISLRNTACP